MHGFDLVHPFLGRVVRRVGGARRIVDEPGALRVVRGLLVDVPDGVVGHRGDQVPLAFLAVIGVDRRGIAVEAARLPLAGVAADEAVEVFVAVPDRKLVEWPRRGRRPDRHVVVLAEPSGGVAVEFQRQSPVCAFGVGHGVVARVAGGRFGHHAVGDGVVIPPREQGGPGRRTERGVVHLGVAQAALRQLIHRRRRHDAAESRVRGEAGVVDQDQQHVRRAFRRPDSRRPARRALEEVRFYNAFEGRRRRRQHRAVGELDRRRRLRAGGCAEADGAERRRQRAFGR